MDVQRARQEGHQHGDAGRVHGPEHEAEQADGGCAHGRKPDHGEEGLEAESQDEVQRDGVPHPEPVGEEAEDEPADAHAQVEERREQAAHDERGAAGARHVDDNPAGDGRCGRRGQHSQPR